MKKEIVDNESGKILSSKLDLLACVSGGCRERVTRVSRRVAMKRRTIVLGVKIKKRSIERYRKKKKKQPVSRKVGNAAVSVARYDVFLCLPFSIPGRSGNYHS